MPNSVNNKIVEIDDSSWELKISVWNSDMILKVGFTKVTLSFWGKEKTMPIQSMQAQFFVGFLKWNPTTIANILGKISESKDSRDKIEASINATLKEFWLELDWDNIVNINESLKFKDIIKRKVIDALNSIVYVEWMPVQYLEEDDILLINEQEVIFTNTQLDIFLYFLSQTLWTDYSTEKKYDAGTIRVHINKVNLVLRVVGLKIGPTNINNSEPSSYTIKKL